MIPAMIIAKNRLSPIQIRKVSLKISLEATTNQQAAGANMSLP